MTENIFTFTYKFYVENITLRSHQMFLLPLKNNKTSPTNKIVPTIKKDLNDQF